MTHLPGKRGEAWGERHWRSLAVDVARLRDVHRVDRLVLLVEDAELRWWGAQGLLPALHECGIAVQRHPIVDGWIPEDEAGFRGLLRDVRSALATGETVAIACVGGFGRTGTLVACLLIELGLPAAATMELTRTIRPGTIGFEPQEHFVRRFEQRRRLSARQVRNLAAEENGDVPPGVESAGRPSRSEA
jgi:protein-tyrosine phosphatase